MLPGGSPLEAFTVGVTSNHRSDTQIELWRRSGAGVEHAPMVELVPLELSVIAETIRAVIDSRPRLVVFTSSAGVKGIFDAAMQVGLSTPLSEVIDTAMVICTETEAAAELVSWGFGVDATLRAATPTELNELIVRWCPDAQLVAIQLDGGDDEWAVGTVAAMGRDPMPLLSYRWGPPVDVDRARRFVRRVAEGKLDAVTFTTEGAVEQFTLIAEALGVRSRALETTAVCLGNASAGRAAAVGFGDVITPRRSGLAAMVRITEVAFSERGRVIDLAGHSLSLRGRQVSLDDEPVLLSDREREVLVRLAERPGAVVSKAELVRTVWGDVNADHHVAEVSVARLRQRLGDAGVGIETVIRRGYRLNVDTG